jgi:serine phosphatase RsbU (regulator of sigma subunit)
MARGLGGDYFDFINMPDDCQLVLIGDVTGHGLHASIVMSLLYGFIYRASLNQCDCLKIATDVNEFLEDFSRRSEDLDHFFSTTFFCGIIHPVKLAMHYVNAGHVPPLVRRGESILELENTAQPLGFFVNPEIEMGSFQFQKHDRFLLYTDGVTEAFNDKEESFGRERLEKQLGEDRSDHLTFLDNLFKVLEDFAGNAPLTDDSTAICIDFHGF